jgi:hypothetical protein
MTYSTEYREYIQAIVKDYNEHPFERDEDVRVRCLHCENSVESDGDTCEECKEHELKHAPDPVFLDPYEPLLGHFHA